jgi:hypothetical protein
VRVNPLKSFVASPETSLPAATITYAEALLHCKKALAHVAGLTVYDALQHELALLLSWTFPP